jgi:hypothetical protein
VDTIFLTRSTVFILDCTQPLLKLQALTRSFGILRTYTDEDMSFVGGLQYVLAIVFSPFTFYDLPNLCKWQVSHNFTD